MVEVYPKELEIQRVINLVQGFGWTKVKEEMVGADLIITIKKEILPEETVVEVPPPS